MARVQKMNPPSAGYLLDLNEREMYVLRRSIEERQRYFTRPGNVAAIKELLQKLPSNLPDH